MNSNEKTYGAVYAALGIIWLILSFAPLLPDPNAIRQSGSPIGAFFVLAALGTVHIIAGVGLRQGRPRARATIQVLAILYLLGFPLFTLLGGLTLYALRRDIVAA